MNLLKRLAKACITLKNSLSAFVDKKKSPMALDTSIYGQAVLDQKFGSGTISSAQNAAMQRGAYNSMMQNPQAVWKEYERTSPNVGINIERASNGYIIRSQGTLVVATTLEDLQQHVTAIVVSSLVLSEGK